MLQKLVIDTNVLVSAVLSTSFPALIVESLFLDRTKEWCVSPVVMQEYRDVLSRAKFFKYPGFARNSEILLLSIEQYAKSYIPEVRLNVISDPNDNRFIELAVASQAHFLITGNTNDFQLSHYLETKIVTPKHYWEACR